MSIRLYCLALPFTLGLVSAVLTAQSTPGSIQGVWQTVEVTISGPGGRTIKPQPNLTIISGTHYSRTEVQAEQPRPVLADPTKASVGSGKPVTAVHPAGTRTFRPVVRAASGNFLEMYDFQVFGDYGGGNRAQFFSKRERIRVADTLWGDLGAGFLMRPPGAIVLGAHIDHRGPRDGLLARGLSG